MNEIRQSPPQLCCMCGDAPISLYKMPLLLQQKKASDPWRDAEFDQAKRRWRIDKESDQMRWLCRPCWSSSKGVEKVYYKPYRPRKKK